MNITTSRIIFGLLIVLLLSFSCKEKSTNPETQLAISFSSQSSKCLSHGLAKSSSLDSLFTYTFSEKLIVDFSVSANCCPDSNRFNITQKISGDTLIVSVADTAINGCRCNCPYSVHVEFGGLTKDQYVVRCMIDNYSSVLNPIHLVNVYRKK